MPDSPCCGTRRVPTAPLQLQPVPGAVGLAAGTTAPLLDRTGAPGMQMWPWFFCSPSTVRPTLSSRNSKQMPAAVAEALQSVLQLEGGLSPSEAEEHLAALERSQRFQSETWS